MSTVLAAIVLILTLVLIYVLSQNSNAKSPFKVGDIPDCDCDAINKGLTSCATGCPSKIVINDDSLGTDEAGNATDPIGISNINYNVDNANEYVDGDGMPKIINPGEVSYLKDHWIKVGSETYPDGQPYDLMPRPQTAIPYRQLYNDMKRLQKANNYCQAEPDYENTKKYDDLIPGHQGQQYQYLRNKNKAELSAAQADLHANRSAHKNPSEVTYDDLMKPRPVMRCASQRQQDLLDAEESFEYAMARYDRPLHADQYYDMMNENENASYQARHDLAADAYD